MSGLTSAKAVAWAVSTVRSMQLTRVAAVVAMLCAGISMLGAVLIATQKPEPARRTAPVATLTKSGEPERPPTTVPKNRLVSVRVIDHMGRGVRNASVHAFELGQLSDTRVSNG